MVLHPMLTTMQQPEVERCLAVLREFTKLSGAGSAWRPRLAVPGGERAMDALLESQSRDSIPRNVRPRIEASLTVDKTMSMRSTIAAYQRSMMMRQLVAIPEQPSALVAPADRVSQLQILIDRIVASHRHMTAATAQSTTAGMMLPSLGCEPSASGSNMYNAENLSSAELLDILYRRIAAQQIAPGTAQKCASWPLARTAPSGFGVVATDASSGQAKPQVNACNHVDFPILKTIKRF